MKTLAAYADWMKAMFTPFVMHIQAP